MWSSTFPSFCRPFFSLSFLFALLSLLLSSYIFLSFFYGNHIWCKIDGVIILCYVFSLRTAHSRSTTAMSTASRIAREIHDEEIDKYSSRTYTPLHRLSADTDQLVDQYVRPTSQNSGGAQDRYENLGNWE